MCGWCLTCPELRDNVRLPLDLDRQRELEFAVLDSVDHIPSSVRLRVET